MKNYQITMGLEIHTQLNTTHKVFSNSLNIYSSTPNEYTNEVDLALPGTLPFLNIEVVKKAIVLGKAMNMELNPILAFNRKVYFHYDLPKGYQITQFGDNVIAKNGIVKLNNGKEIAINEFHIEEDTAKQIQNGNNNFLDYNRCGSPLIEIVTHPVFHTKEEVIEFLTKLKRILVFLNISDGKMEESSLRVDLNISISDSDILGTRVEVKNMNSFSSVALAIEHEYHRQLSLLNKGDEVIQETRKWDDKEQKTIFMRQKKDPCEYFYTKDTNILPLNITKLINTTFLDPSTLPDNISKKLASYNLPTNIDEVMLNNLSLYNLFEKVNDAVKDPNLVVTWIIIETVKIANKMNLTIEKLDENLIQKIIDMILLIKSNKINAKQGKIIIEHLFTSTKTVSQIIEELGFSQITDASFLYKIVQNILENNKEVIVSNKDRIERIEKFFIGLVMKETKGQANPNIVKNIYDDLIKKYI